MSPLLTRIVAITGKGYLVAFKDWDILGSPAIHVRVGKKLSDDNTVHCDINVTLDLLTYSSIGGDAIMEMNLKRLEYKLERAIQERELDRVTD